MISCFSVQYKGPLKFSIINLKTILWWIHNDYFFTYIHSYYSSLALALFFIKRNTSKKRKEKAQNKPKTKKTKKEQGNAYWAFVILILKKLTYIWISKMQKVKSKPKVNWITTFSLAKAQGKSTSKQPQNKANSDLHARVFPEFPHKTAVTSVCRAYSRAKPKNKDKSE